jgi:rSAM/selenodomain-associated transferase 2
VADSSPPGPIAVVVPTLNEAPRIAGLISRLHRQDISEIIVVDGGSTDGTREAVRATGMALLVNARLGRGYQIRAGIAVASAPIIIVLHADTELPADAARIVRETLAMPGVSGGCFSLAFDRRRPLLDLYAYAGRFDSAITSFGDQAMFFRRDTLEAAGGMPDQPLFEDIELRRRLRRHGRFLKRPETVTTSARRFDAEGAFTAQLCNACLLSAYWAGVPPGRLAAIYGRRPR